MRAAMILVAAAACAARDPKADEAQKRIAALEAQVAEQTRAIAELKAEVAASSDLGPVLDQLEELMSRVVRLEARPGAVPHKPRPEPDKAAVYSVPIASSPAYGSAKAKVTLVMAMDFACPYCRRAWTTVDDLQKKYGADLRVVYKAMIVHPTVATHSALAACAANHQGKFKELAELIWAKSFDVHDFADGTIDGLAAEAKLDVARYKNDLAGPCAQEVNDEQALMAKVGVGATPSFFINGRYLAGAQPQPEFEKLVDEELAKATAAIKKGVPAAKYYEQEIVGKGLKELAAPATP